MTIEPGQLGSWLMVLSLGLMVGCGWFRKKPSSELRVTGRVAEKYDYEVPSKVAGKAPRVETRIRLEDIEAEIDGNAMADIGGTLFGAEPDLVQEVQVGDRVEIVASPPTSRKVKSIRKLSE